MHFGSLSTFTRWSALVTSLYWTHVVSWLLGNMDRQRYSERVQGAVKSKPAMFSLLVAG